MATKHKMPAFRSEQEEAAWWDAHPEVITELFLKARKEGRIKRLPIGRLGMNNARSGGWATRLDREHHGLALRIGNVGLLESRPPLIPRLPYEITSPDC